jgi:TetR/AcrR family transcriptional regulator, fatty acid metabolism regulator protein
MQKEIPRQSLRERQRKERENLILQAAEEVLSEKGYHETSMDEIAARVGIAKGTVYLHFPSKEDLIFALFERELQTFLHLVDEAAVREGSVRSRLETILHGLYRGLIGKRLQLLISLYTNQEIRQELLEKKQQVHVCLEQVAAQVSALLEEGKAKGEFDTAIPTPVMLTLFFSLFSPLGYKRLIVEDHMPVEELVGYLADFYFKGIAAK